MAININALTTGTGGLETTADASGSFAFQSDGTTIATVTSSGFSVTGTFNAGSLQVGGSDVVVDTDIGSTVQAYDADTTKNDVANTFTANQTINADLIVDTTTLVVDSANNRVGIGTSSPTQKLHIDGTEAIKTRLQRSSNYSDISISSSGQLNFDNLSSYGFGWYINSSEKMRIDSSGNVGIGTSSPSTKVHIQQSAVTSAPSRSAALYLENNSNCEIQFVGNPANDCQLRFGTSSNSFKGAVEYQLDVDALLAYTNGSERMRIDSSGNVGIGTSSPSTNLNVRGGIGAASTTETTTQSNSLFALSSPATGTKLYQGIEGGSSVWLQAQNTDNSLKTIALNPAGGNVGIGTNSPSTALEVSGTVTATAFSGDGSNLTGVSAGKVLQIQYTNADTRASYSAPNTNTPTEMTPLTTSITPTSASSKILIMISMFVEGPQDVIYKLYRGGTVIGRNSSSTSRWSGTAVNNYDIDNANTPFMVTFNYVDSPATTSATTYSVRCQSSNSINYTTYLNRCVNNAGADSTEVGMSCVTLMEVA